MRFRLGILLKCAATLIDSGIPESQCAACLTQGQVPEQKSGVLMVDWGEFSESSSDAKVAARRAHQGLQVATVYGFCSQTESVTH